MGHIGYVSHHAVRYAVAYRHAICYLLASVLSISLPSLPQSDDQVRHDKCNELRSIAPRGVCESGHSPQQVEAFMRTQTLVQSLFREAAQAWLESRKPYISEKTHHEYLLNIHTLSLEKHFGLLRLGEITADDIRKYQRARKQEGCGPSGVNHETCVIQQMLKRVGLWPRIAADFQPLPLPKEKPGRIINEQEKQRLLRIASTNPDWEAAYLFAVISSNTGIGPKECATLKLSSSSIDLEGRRLFVQPEGAKNIHRIRKITLNEEALRGATLAVNRARRLGAFESWHYVFPLRIKRNLFDPTRHQTSFKTAWKKMTVAAKLGGLKMYDLRRTVATKLLGDPRTSLEEARQIMGHLAKDTILKYSYQQEEKIRGALDRVWEKKAPISVSKTTALPPEENLDALAKTLLMAMAKILKTG